jgi:hypothetical protein
MSTKAGNSGSRVPWGAPLPAKLKEALTTYNESHAITEQLERLLGIETRWTKDSPEYKEALQWSGERRCRLTLDRLE